MECIRGGENVASLSSPAGAKCQPDARFGRLHQASIFLISLFVWFCADNAFTCSKEVDDLFFPFLCYTFRSIGIYKKKLHFSLPASLNYSLLHVIILL